LTTARLLKYVRGVGETADFHDTEGEKMGSDLQFKKSSYWTAQAVVERWHYSRCMPTGKHVCFEWSCEEAPYVVAVYGNGVNPYQAAYLTKITGLQIMNTNYLELTRLARIEPKREDAPLTKFLSLCHRALRETGIEWIVSFSDPEQAHTGGIYRAANFFPAGKTAPEWHLIDRDGNKHHRRLAYRHSRRNDMTVAQSREELGLLRVKTQQKQRWLLPLNPAHRKHLQCISHLLECADVGKAKSASKQSSRETP